jgi:hypothetical protein
LRLVGSDDEKTEFEVRFLVAKTTASILASHA